MEKGDAMQLSTDKHLADDPAKTPGSPLAEIGQAVSVRPHSRQLGVAFPLIRQVKHRRVSAQSCTREC